MRRVSLLFETGPKNRSRETDLRAGFYGAGDGREGPDQAVGKVHTSSAETLSNLEHISGRAMIENKARNGIFGHIPASRPSEFIPFGSQRPLISGPLYAPSFPSFAFLLLV